MKSTLALTILSLALSLHSEVVFTDGRTMDGTPVRTNGNDVTVVLDYAVFNFSRGSIKEISGGAGDLSTNRLPTFRKVLTTLSGQGWGANWSQIPATVIEKGVFRNVPYVSFRCGDDYEVNVYGDLKEPAAIEAGVYRKLLSDDAAKQNCLAFVRSLLGDPEDQRVLQSISPEKDLKAREDLTFEVTPPTAEDAYGGWWISVFSERKLNRSRASETELEKISVPKSAALSVKAEDDGQEWSTAELKQARPSETISFISPSGEVVTNASIVRVDGAYLVWRTGASGGRVRLADLPEGLRSSLGYDESKATAMYASEDRRQILLAQERAATPAPAPAPVARQGQSEDYGSASSLSSSGSSYGGGRVYVRSYVRKDGTLVRAHTRSAPRR